MRVNIVVSLSTFVKGVKSNMKYYVKAEWKKINGQMDLVATATEFDSELMNDLDHLQELVGGYIEVASISIRLAGEAKRFIIVCDEEFFMKKNSDSCVITDIRFSDGAERNGAARRVIGGDFVLMKNAGPDSEDDFDGIDLGDANCLEFVDNNGKAYIASIMEQS